MGDETNGRRSKIWKLGLWRTTANTSKHAFHFRGSSCLVRNFLNFSPRQWVLVYGITDNESNWLMGSNLSKLTSLSHLIYFKFICLLLSISKCYRFLSFQSDPVSCASCTLITLKPSWQRRHPFETMVNTIIRLILPVFQRPYGIMKTKWM